MLGTRGEENSRDEDNRHDTGCQPFGIFPARPMLVSFSIEFVRTSHRKPAFLSLNQNSFQKGIGVLYRETLFAGEDRIAGSQTVELIAERVDNEQVAVRTVVVTQTKIHAYRILVDRIDLDQQRGRQKPAERITAIDRTDVHVEDSLRETKAIPRVYRRYRDLGRRSIARAGAKLI